MNLPSSFFGQQNDRAALEHFVQQVYWGEELAAEQSRKNLEEGLVELRAPGGHVANGLLVTEHGYFITAAHCLEGWEELQVRLADGTAYSIQKLGGVDQENDLALAKVNLTAEQKSKHYRFYDSTHLKKLKREPVALYTRWDGKVVQKYGWVEKDSERVTVTGRQREALQKDLLYLSLASIPGDSGGILLNTDGRLVGINCSGNTEQRTSSEVKLFKALDLITRYAETL